MNRVIWVLGISGAGKTTLAKKIIENHLYPYALHIDEEEYRKNVSYDLGDSKKDNDENIRRIVGTCKMFPCRLIVVSANAHLESQRQYARENIEGYYEVWVKASIDACIKRLAQENRCLTSLDLKFENPKNADYVVNNLNLNKTASEVYNDSHWQWAHPKVGAKK